MKTEAAQAAAIIRKELKSNGITAKVKSSNYSGGSSIDVTVYQDITPAALDEIKSYCDGFQYGDFDGMTDSYNYRSNRDDRPTARFVFVSVNYSDEIKAAARAYIDNIDGFNDDYEKQRYTSMALGGSWGDFWTTRKPRIKIAA